MSKLISIENIAFNDLKQIKDKDIVAIISIVLLNGYCHSLEIDNLLDYGFSKEDINNIFKKIPQYFNLKKIQNNYIISKNEINYDNMQSLIKAFWGSNFILKGDFETALKKVSDEIFRSQKYLTVSGISNNDDNIFYKFILAKDIIDEYKICLSRTDIFIINKWLCQSKIPIIIFKYVFILSIKENVYKTFNANFFEKIINQFNRHNILTLEEAKMYTKKRNEMLKDNAKVYVKPEYNQELDQQAKVGELDQLRGLLDE